VCFHQEIYYAIVVGRVQISFICNKSACFFNRPLLYLFRALLIMAWPASVNKLFENFVALYALQIFYNYLAVFLHLSICLKMMDHVTCLKFHSCTVTRHRQTRMFVNVCFSWKYCDANHLPFTMCKFSCNSCARVFFPCTPPLVLLRTISSSFLFIFI
jgi:hypothetical protein